MQDKFRPVAGFSKVAGNLAKRQPPASSFLIIMFNFIYVSRNAFRILISKVRFINQKLIRKLI